METSGSSLLPLLANDVLLGVVGWDLGSGSVLERERDRGMWVVTSYPHTI